MPQQDGNKSHAREDFKAERWTSAALSEAASYQIFEQDLKFSHLHATILKKHHITNFCECLLK